MWSSLSSQAGYELGTAQPQLVFVYRYDLIFSPPALCLRWSSLASQSGSELGTAQPQLVFLFQEIFFQSSISVSFYLF